MEVIKSKDNIYVKEIRKLKIKKNRKKKNEFLVEGVRFVCEALKSNFTVKYILLSEICNPKYIKLLKENDLTDIKVITVSKEIMNNLSNTMNSQGILAVVENNFYNDNNFKNENDAEGFYVLTDGIQDPGNLGTIIRTCHAAGALGIIVTKGTVDVFNDKTLRSTMGSIFYLPVIHDEDLTFVKKLKNDGYKILASYLDSSSKNIYDINLRGRLIICVGNEGNGISNEVLKLSDIKVKIPMPGGTESLNAAVAASILIYEKVRENINIKL